jgi:hypothetical protein
MATLDHTPGPWSYYISENCESEFEIYGDCCPIGTVERWNGDDNDELKGQAEANARLVAEAPMLLDAILDIKRLADKAGDSEYDAFEYALLELISDRVQQALCFINERSAS